MDDIRKIIEEAISLNEFDVFLEGKYHYSLNSNSHFANMSTPNDYVKILKEGLYLYDETRLSDIKKILEDSLKRMIIQDEFGMFCAIEILYSQMVFEQKKEAPFSIDIQDILELLQIEIIKRKDNLIRYYDWEGRNEKEGLYGYLKRMNVVFKKRFSCSFL